MHNCQNGILFLIDDYWILFCFGKRLSEAVWIAARCRRIVDRAYFIPFVIGYDVVAVSSAIIAKLIDFAAVIIILNNHRSFARFLLESVDGA